MIYDNPFTQINSLSEDSDSLVKGKDCQLTESYVQLVDVDLIMTWF